MKRSVGIRFDACVIASIIRLVKLPFASIYRDGRKNRHATRRPLCGAMHLMQQNYESFVALDYRTEID